MDARALVAMNLRRIRVSRGVSQEALAVDANVDRTYVSRLERNLENPTVVILERLTSALEADITELFRRPTPGQKSLQPLRPGRRAKSS